MSKNIIIAIGGTGARVLKALLFQLASDQWQNPVEVIPVLVDNDINNPAFQDCQSLTKTYRNIREVFVKQSENVIANNPAPLNPRRMRDTQVETFFKNRIGEVQTLSSSSEVINENYKLATVLGANNANHGTEDDFLKYFFSENEITQSLNTGFYGMPNVGNLAFDTAFNTRLSKLCGGWNLQKDGGNKVFIIGSLFGGTGAAGIPKIYEYMSQNTEYDEVRDAQYYLVPVLPYFQLDGKESKKNDTKIRSELWNTKARYALEYYKEKFRGKKKLKFLLPEPTGELPSYKYNLEGKDQKNPPHILELETANAICHSMGGNLYRLEQEDMVIHDRFNFRSLLFMSRLYMMGRAHPNLFTRNDCGKFYFECKYNSEGGTHEVNHIQDFIDKFITFITGLNDAELGGQYAIYQPNTTLDLMFINNNVTCDNHVLNNDIVKRKFDISTMIQDTGAVTLKRFLEEVSELFGKLTITNPN